MPPSPDTSRPRPLLLAIGSGAMGGGTSHVLQLLERLDRRRWRPALACDPRGMLASKAAVLEVPVIPLPFMDGRLQMRVVLALRRILVDGSFALVHAHGTRAALSVRCALARAPRAPFVYSEHGLAIDVPRGRLLRALAAGAEKTIGRRADRLLVLSEYARRHILTLEPGLADRIRVVPNGVAPSSAPRRRVIRRRLEIPEGSPVVGTVTRLVEQKAPLDFLESAARVAAQRPDVRFVVIGDGPLRRTTEAEAARRGLAVTFTGARQDAAALLGGFDIFCLPSRWEGLPIALLEAMAAGLAVIATGVGGVPEVVDPEVTGLLVPPGEPPAMAQATLDLLADPRRRARLGEAARERIAARHSIEVMVRRIAAVYEELLGS